VERGEGCGSGSAVERLAATLLRALREGLEVDPPTSAFLASQLGEASAQALADVLGDPSHPDHDTVLDYLCSPGPALRHEVETILLKAGDGGASCLLAGQVVDALRAAVPGVDAGTFAVDVRLDGGVIGSVSLSVADLSSLVGRLRLDAGPDASTTRVMAAVLSGEALVQARLAVRAARIPCTVFHADLVASFFRCVPVTSPHGEEVLRLWLDILENLPEGGDPVAAVRRRRDRLVRAAREADAFFARLARYNMEMLMMQGMSAPAIDGDEARRRAYLLDRLCLALFGVVLDDERSFQTGEADLGVLDLDAGPDAVPDAVARLFDAV
jgi:hypothetical protein